MWLVASCVLFCGLLLLRCGVLLCTAVEAVVVPSRSSPPLAFTRYIPNFGAASPASHTLNLRFVRCVCVRVRSRAKERKRLIVTQVAAVEGEREIALKSAFNAAFQR